MAARAINSYDVGETARLACLFSDSAGVAADPGVVVCKVKSPSGVSSTPVVNRLEAGSYYADVEVTEAGAWSYRFEGTGGGLPNAADEHQFLANRTEF